MSLDKAAQNTTRNRLGSNTEPVSSHTLSATQTDRQAAQAQQASSSMWLVSFTDVMALMLTFFVLLFSMAEPDKETWQGMVKTLRQELNKYYGPVYSRGPQDMINIEKVDFEIALDLTYLESLIERLASRNEQLRQMEVIEMEDQLVLALPGSLLFESGSNRVSETGREALFPLATMLGRIKNAVEIIGHTDPEVVTDKTRGSNWALSLRRSLAVANVLEEMGYDESPVVRGLSSAHYRYIPAEMDKETRAAMARRVDIVISPHIKSRYQ